MIIEAAEFLKLAAYLVALVYCWRIRADHPHPARMRRAWTWLALSSALSVLRHAFELSGYLAGWELDRMSWRQILIVLALLALTAGLLELASAFRAVGFGLHWRRLDWLWLAAIVLLAVPVVLNRDRLGDANSTVAAMRYLQYLSSLLLAVPAALALGLHRISVEMTGGKWATALQWMVAFLVARLVCLCLLTAVPDSWLPMTLLGTAAPWMFVLAAAERWNVTRAAERMSEQIFVGANKAS
ncbi:MAG: hypothetical protein NTV52_32115 [Acidobacteria bacterium]|nr:hypothetical protein [Acidobacteriota bacterium]